MVGTVVGSQVKGNALCTSARARKKDVFGVAAKLFNVVLYPLHELALVVEANIGGNVVAVGKEAIRPNAVIEANKDEVISIIFQKAGCIDVGVGLNTKATALDV